MQNDVEVRDGRAALLRSEPTLFPYEIDDTAPARELKWWLPAVTVVSLTGFIGLAVLDGNRTASSDRHICNALVTCKARTAPSPASNEGKFPSLPADPSLPARGNSRDDGKKVVVAQIALQPSFRHRAP